MLRCCQLILRLRNNGTRNVPLIWSSPDVKLQRVFYATKFNLRDKPPRNTEAIEVPSDETGSDSVTIPRPSSSNVSSVYTRSTYPLEPEEDFSVPCDSALTRPGGVWIAGDRPGPAPGSPKACLPTSNPQFVSVRAPEPQRTALLQDPPVHAENPPQLVSSRGLAVALELVSKLTTSTASGPSLISDLIALKSIFKCVGPQVLRRLDAKTSANLLCLLGTISDDKNIRRFHSSSEQWSRGLARLNWWAEVIQAAEAKEEMGHVLGEKEIQWTMRAYLERSRLTSFPAARDMAKVYYSRLPAGMQSDPDVIIPYLNTFLACPTAPGFQDALDTLCDQLVKQNNPCRGVVDILWNVIYNSGALSPEHKSTILTAMLHRLFSPDSDGLTGQGDPLLCIDDLVMGLAGSFFPCHQKPGLPANLFSWLKHCVRASIAEELPIDDRFSNLVPIATWLLQKELLGSIGLHVASNNLKWRAIINLAILDWSLRSRSVAFAEQREMKDIARSLWHLWKDVTTFDIPREVRRVVAIAFLHAACRLRDELLLDACSEYISSDALWVVSRCREPEARQVEQLFSALTDCVLVFKGRMWTKLLSLLGNVLHHPSHLSTYLPRIIRQLGTRDPALAYQFYHACLSHGLPVPSEASILVAQYLALVHSWDQVTTFLRDAGSDDALLGQLLEVILSTFQRSRQESTSPILATAVGEALLERFSTTKIPGRLKFPIRFFLPVMIASQRPQKAVQVLETLLHNHPIMFTSRYFLRLIRRLLHHRQPALAIKVLRLAIKTFKGEPLTVNDLVRKTRQSLIRAGATKLAFHPRMAPQRSTQSVRDRLVRFSVLKPARWMGQAILQMLPALSVSPVNGPNILAAVQTLTRNRRFSLARQLIKQSHTQLKPRDMTAIGNAYLHGPLLYWDKRNRRLMQHVLRSKDFLVQKHGFVPDRVTVNIVIKAMLRWRVHIDSRMVLALFDHLVRNGYPASERWHVANGVPFGTLPGEMALDLSGIHQGMSFKRHVRPLYKMFIRELFLRKNPRAAHRIIGILKEEEALAAEVKEHRERARRLGVAKKQRKRASACRDGDRSDL